MGEIEFRGLPLLTDSVESGGQTLGFDRELGTRQITEQNYQMRSTL
jgi:hypothetical protein